MKSFVLALQFLTVCTLNSGLRAEPADLARSRAWYGVVGGLLGLTLAGLTWLLGLVLPHLALAGVLVWPGLAHPLFALRRSGGHGRRPGAHHQPGAALEIMKDTRLGSFGVAALGGMMLVKFAALASLQGSALLGGLVAAPALARGLAAMLAGLLPPARPGQGLGAAVAQDRGLGTSCLAAGSALAIALLAAGSAGAVAAMAVMVLGLILGLWFTRRIQGVTGDTLGAAIEAGEVVALLTLSCLG